MARNCGDCTKRYCILDVRIFIVLHAEIFGNQSQLILFINRSTRLELHSKYDELS